MSYMAVPLTDAGTLDTLDSLDFALVSSMTRTINVLIGDGTNVITTGLQGGFSIGVAATITKAKVMGVAPTGNVSIVLDLWKDVSANVPTAADTITASAKPTLSTAAIADDTTLTGWTTAVTARDNFIVNVDSVTTATLVLLALEITVT